MEKYLTPAEVCELIPGVTENHLRQLRFRGNGPRFIKVTPRKVVYAESAVVEFLAAREQLSTRENIPA